MPKLTLLFLLFFSFALFAQNGPINPLSSRSNGIANASVAFTGINSLFNNQAGLAELKNKSVLLSAQESFRNPNSDNMGIGFAMPITAGAVGFNAHYFEGGDIWQTKIGIAYARKLLETLSIGAQFDWLSTQISSHETSHLFTFELGLQYQLEEKLLLGVHLYNPAKLEIIEDEYLPTIIRAGGTYSPYKKLLIHAELEKALDFPLVFKSGIEYELVNDLWFRIGFQHKPRTFNFGMGYLFKKRFRFDMSAYYQRGLNLVSSGILGASGFVPSFGLGYDFVKK